MMWQEVENMKDIPFFTTEYGVASLTLSQIPYRATAYIQVLTAQEGMRSALIADCSGFCRAAGADHIFWSAEDADLPAHSAVVEMRGEAISDPSRTESLFPVTEATVSSWRQIHNERMASVDHARYLTTADEKEILSSGAYFIHRDGTLLGIGWLTDDTIRAIASVQPGAGECVLHTLMTLAPGQMLRLEVASTNTKALALYERNGFFAVKNIKIWCAVQ